MYCDCTPYLPDVSEGKCRPFRTHESHPYTEPYWKYHQGMEGREGGRGGREEGREGGREGGRKGGREEGREGGEGGRDRWPSSSCFFSKVSEQCEDDTASDEEEEGEEGEVYGITTVINLTQHSVSIFSVHTIAYIQFHGWPSILLSVIIIIHSHMF